MLPYLLRFLHTLSLWGCCALMSVCLCIFYYRRKHIKAHCETTTTTVVTDIPQLSTTSTCDDDNLTKVTTSVKAEKTVITTSDVAKETNTHLATDNACGWTDHCFKRAHTCITLMKDLGCKLLALFYTKHELIKQEIHQTKQDAKNMVVDTLNDMSKLACLPPVAKSTPCENTATVTDCDINHDPARAIKMAYTDSIDIPVAVEKQCAPVVSEKACARDVVEAPVVVDCEEEERGPLIKRTVHFEATSAKLNSDKHTCHDTHTSIEPKKHVEHENHVTHLMDNPIVRMMAHDNRETPEQLVKRSIHVSATSAHVQKAKPCSPPPVVHEKCYTPLPVAPPSCKSDCDTAKFVEQLTNKYNAAASSTTTPSITATGPTMVKPNHTTVESMIRYLEHSKPMATHPSGHGVVSIPMHPSGHGVVSTPTVRHPGNLGGYLQTFDPAYRAPKINQPVQHVSREEHQRKAVQEFTEQQKRKGFWGRLLQ